MWDVLDIPTVKDEPVSAVVSECQERVTCELYVDNHPVSLATVSTFSTEWRIIMWNTKKEFRRKGYGRAALTLVLQYAAHKRGKIPDIYYVWNEAHKYVYDWLRRNFAVAEYAEFSCYKLDAQCVKDYFKLEV